MNNPVELFQAAIRQAVIDGFSGLHVSLPGRVEEYDAATQCALVQPLLRRARDAAGERVVITLPPIPNVPVVTLRGGGFRFHLPVQKGDTVWLIFCSGSLDKWLQRGGIVDPQDDRRHHLSDAIALPGILDFAHAWDDLPVDRAVLGYDGQAQLEIFPDGQIHAGGSSSLATKADHDALRDFIANTMVVVTPGGNSDPGTLAPPPTSTGTQKLKGG